MTIEIKINGAQGEFLRADAGALLSEVGGVEPDARNEAPDRSRKREVATGLAAASLILSIPGAVVATIELADRVRLRDRVEALKEQLAASNADAVLTIEGMRPIDLKQTATDAVVDLLLKERGV